MKKIYVLWSLAIATLMANVFFACKSDDTIEEFYAQRGFTLNPVQNPDFVIYSNGNVLSSTLGTRGEFMTTRGEGDAAVYSTWNVPEGYSFPSAMSESDKQAVLSVIASATETTTDATDYYVQWVGGNPVGLTNFTINGLLVNNSNQYYWNDVVFVNTPLTNVTFDKNGSTVSNKYKLFAIDGGIYLGLDGDDDNVYNDWVFKITPATTSQGGGTDVVVNSNYYKVQDWENTTKEHMPAEYAQYVDNAPEKGNRLKENGIDPEAVSQDEYDHVMAYLAQHPDEGGLTCDLTTYFIQNVGGSYDEYTYEDYPSLDDQNGAEHGVVGSQQMNFVAFSKHRNDYNAVGGPRALCVNIPIEDPTYHDSWGDKNNTRQNAYRFYVIEYNNEKNLYLCYDYQTEKNSGEYFYGDKVFNDWVIKIIPADGSNPEDHVSDLVDNGGGDNGGGDNGGGDNGGGDNGGGDNGGGDNGGGDNGGGTTPPSVKGEVEVNFSVNDEKEEDDYIATKLSIHIRALTDVEVFIPVQQIYYCDKDDMAIVLNHQLDPNYQYSNPGQSSIENGFSYTYTVAGEYVKDNETLTANEKILITVKYEEGGIRVTTTGVTQAAIDYLRYKYKDGITVEVWNYFNSEIPSGEDGKDRTPVTRTDLKPMFDASTVKFSANPQYYVNAFAMLYDYKKEDIHVYMKPEDGKPYLLNVVRNAEGHVISETPTDNLLARKYWVADAEGNFVDFVGEKNAWDCKVTPPNAYSIVATNTGANPANWNVIYEK